MFEWLSVTDTKTEIARPWGKHILKFTPIFQVGDNIYEIQRNFKNAI